MSRYFKKQAFGVFLMMLFIFAKVVFFNRFNILKGQLIDAAVGNLAIKLSELILIFCLFLLLYLFSSYLLGVTRYNVKLKTMKYLKDDFFYSSIKRSREDVRKLDISKAISSYTAEMKLIEIKYLTMGGNLLEYIASIVITLISIAIIDFRMAFLSLAIYVLPVFFTKSQQNKLTQAQKKFQSENDKHTDSFLKNLSGVEAIKNYKIEKKILKLFNISLNNLVKEDISRSETQAKTNGVSSMITYFSQAIIAGFSIFLVFKKEISAGEFVSIFALSSAISGQIYWLANAVEAVISAKPAVKSVIEYIDYPKKKEISSYFQSMRDDSLAIQVKNLSFNYGENKIFNNLNLDIKKGEKILILGGSGSGKSSLMSLIMGYIKPNNGDIKLCMKNEDDLLTMVNQDAFIFRGTIVENLFIDNEDEINKATELINKLGLSSIWKEKQLDERGRNLSGGERKRLALARGLLRDSSILILDEPLANVDEENIERIEKLIIDIKDRTLILISHQVSDYLYSGMDKVYELRDGKLSLNIPQSKQNIVDLNINANSSNGGLYEK